MLRGVMTFEIKEALEEPPMRAQNGPAPSETAVPFFQQDSPPPPPLPIPSLLSTPRLPVRPIFAVIKIAMVTSHIKSEYIWSTLLPNAK